MVKYIASVLFFICSIVWASQVIQGVSGSGAPLGSSLSSGAFFVGNSSNIAAEYNVARLNLDFSLPTEELLTVGQASMGGIPSLGIGWASWGHKDTYASLSMALIQSPAGATAFNFDAAQGLSILANFGVSNPVAFFYPNQVTYARNFTSYYQGATSGSVGITVPSTITDYTMTWPSAVSAAGDVMTFDGSATASFGKVANANVASGAAIAVNKLAALTANRNVQTDASGFLSTPISYATGLVPYGLANGSLTGAAASIYYDSSFPGLQINKGSGVRANLDVNNVTDVTNQVITAGGMAGQTGDLYSAFTSVPAQVWGITSAGLMKVQPGTVGNATGSIYSISDNRTGINWVANEVDIFTSTTSNMAFKTTGTTLSKGVFDVPTGGGPSAPPYTFTARTTDGIYSSAANEVAFATNSTLRGKYTNNGLTLSTGVNDAPSGTAGAPSYSFTSDLNSGIYLNSTGNIRISTASGDRVFINSTGLGVTATPATKFHVSDGSAEYLMKGTGAVATTDATPTTILSFTTASNFSYQVEVMCTARRTGGSAGTAGDSAGYKLFGTFKNVAGTLTQVGTTTAAHTAEDQAGMDCTLGTSGTAIVVTGTGTVNNNFNWEAIMEFERN